MQPPASHQNVVDADGAGNGGILSPLHSHLVAQIGLSAPIVQPKNLQNNKSSGPASGSGDS